jgi:hypothetical protein
MSRNRAPQRLNESRRGPPHGELLNADGTTTRLDGRGLPLNERTQRPESAAPSDLFVNSEGQVVFLDADGAALEARLQGSDDPVTLVVATGASQPRSTTQPADAAADGRAFARAGMPPARLERVQRREQGNAAPVPSTHPDLSTADGQSMARANMTPKQRERLEARDKARRG